MVGLVGYQVIFASYPLMVAALSVPFLGEHVAWRRWLGAVQLAAYGIMTRIAACHDSAETSFFWTGIVGATGMTLVVPLA